MVGGTHVPTVLIMEDDHSIREVQTELFIEEGYQVVAVMHGEGALAVLRCARPMP